MNETNFRILLPLLLAVFVIHRGYYTRKHTSPDQATLKQRAEDAVSRLAGLIGLIGMLSTAAYVVNPGWLEWAALALPGWLRWAGVGVAALGFVLLQWAQVTLGRNWSDTPRMLTNQALVTDGPYRWIRHPIYTAFLLILGSTLLLSSNWLIGLSWTAMTVLETISRIGFEENLMLEYFGDRYRTYMRTTGRLLPKILSN